MELRWNRIVAVVLALAILLLIWRYGGAIGAALEQFSASGPRYHPGSQGLWALGITGVFLLVLVKILLQQPPSQK